MMNDRRFVICDKDALESLWARGKDFMEALDAFVREAIGGPDLRRIEVPRPA